MTHLVNNAEDFADQALDGLLVRRDWSCRAATAFR